MRKICTFMLLLALNSSASAAMNKLSHHSRANCVGFNETVSWEWNNAKLATLIRAIHTKRKSDGTYLIHEMGGYWVFGFRNAQFHWPEGDGPGEPFPNKWEVHGRHYLPTEEWHAFMVEEERVKDCNIYDGWWEV